MVISREFGINIKEMKTEAEKLTAQDRAELTSAIARQNGIPAEGCGWEMGRRREPPVGRSALSASLRSPGADVEGAGALPVSSRVETI